MFSTMKMQFRTIRKDQRDQVRSDKLSESRNGRKIKCNFNLNVEYNYHSDANKF